MLTFLRKTRKSLIESGSARIPASPYTRYLLYAIGEIALVVIGILIALQINNWNEWEKDREEEYLILESMKTNLIRNQSKLNLTIQSNKDRFYSAQVVINHIDQNLPYHDTLTRHFFFGALRGDPLSGYPSKDGYEMFKNSGFDKVTNDSTKQSIIYLFEEVYSTVERWGTYITGFAPTDYLMWPKFFNRTRQTLIPLDYKDIVKSTEVRSYYTQTLTFNSLYLEALEGALEETEYVLRLINDELGDE